MLEKAGSAPTYFSKGFSGARAGRMVVRSLSTTNSTRSPFFSPSRLRISRGTVICPLLLIVLEGAIFTHLLYSKDIMLYGAKGTDRRQECLCHYDSSFPVFLWPGSGGLSFPAAK